MPIPEEKATLVNNSEEYPLLPEGVYEAEVVELELKENIKSKFGLKDKFYIHLGVLDEENRGFHLVHFTSTSYTSGFEGGQASKLYNLVCAVYGERVDDKEKININSLIGGKLRIVVKHNNVGDKTYANITEVMSVKGSTLKGLTEEEKAKCLPKTVQEERTEDVSPDEIP